MCILYGVFFILKPHILFPTMDSYGLLWKKGQWWFFFICFKKKNKDRALHNSSTDNEYSNRNYTLVGIVFLKLKEVVMILFDV